MDAVSSHLEIARFMAPSSLAESTPDFTVRGNVMIHPTAVIGKARLHTAHSHCPLPHSHYCLDCAFT